MPPLADGWVAFGGAVLEGFRGDLRAYSMADIPKEVNHFLPNSLYLSPMISHGMGLCFFLNLFDAAPHKQDVSMELEIVLFLSGDGRGTNFH